MLSNALSLTLLGLTISGDALAQGASSGSSGPVNGSPAHPGANAPRSVGSGITVVPGTAPVATNSGPAPVATQPPPASVATATPPQNAASAAVQALERRDEFIKRSVMQSICRGC